MKPIECYAENRKSRKHPENAKERFTKAKLFTLNGLYVNKPDPDDYVIAHLKINMLRQKC